MASATKTRAKTNKTKKVVAPAAEEHAEETEHTETDLDIKPGKAKKPIEIDEPEAGVIDEKIEDDPLVGASEEDDAADEASLDGEELNPFGDRWEE